MNEIYRGFKLIPPGQRKNNKNWIARGVGRGGIEVSTKALTVEHAKLVIDAALAKVNSHHPDFAYTVGEPMPAWASKAFHAARYRAKKAEMPFTLVRADMISMLVRAGGRCEVSGLPFTIDRFSAAMRRPFVPSLDRIDSSLGYTAENCRLVLFAINVALSDWGADVFHLIATSVGKRIGGPIV
jgi:hypothetical protein